MLVPPLMVVTLSEGDDLIVGEDVGRGFELGFSVLWVPVLGVVGLLEVVALLVIRGGSANAGVSC